MLWCDEIPILTENVSSGHNSVGVIVYSLVKKVKRLFMFLSLFDIIRSQNLINSQNSDIVLYIHVDLVAAANLKINDNK